MLDRLAKLYLEVGIMVRVPKKATGTIADLMGGRKPFEWTEEDEAKYSKAKLLEGVPVAPTKQ